MTRKHRLGIPMPPQFQSSFKSIRPFEKEHLAMNNRSVLFPLFCILSACTTSTAIKYDPWTESKGPIESTSLKFSLQDSNVTLSIPANGKDDDAAKARDRAAAKLPDRPCTANAWWNCFDNVQAKASIAPPLKGSPIYVASANDGVHLDFSSTRLSGVPAPGEDLIYTQITIKYTNNTGTIFTSFGAGAAAGLEFGPGVAVLGGVAGVLGAINTLGLRRHYPVPADSPFLVPKNKPLVHSPNPNVLADYLCDKSEFDLAGFSGVAQLLSLPLTIPAAEARPFANNKGMKIMEPGKTAASECWHALPNTTRLEENNPSHIGDVASVGPRAPEPGDGWLYRFVKDEIAGSEPPPIPTTTYFGDFTDTRQDFPYSSCSKVSIQILWWEELAKAIEEAQSSGPAPNPQAITFKATVADPMNVRVALLKKGGVISFKPDCGANVSMNEDFSNAAAVGAAFAAAQKIADAQKALKDKAKK